MVYDSFSGNVILHGGWGNQNPSDSMNHKDAATWIWDGEQWTKITEKPIFYPALAYNPTTKSVIAFAKNKSKGDARFQLWELKNQEWRIVKDYGVWDDAKYLKQRIAQSPNDEEALAKYADLLLWRKKEYFAAETTYRQLFLLDPSRKNGLLTDFTLSLLMQGKFEEAEKNLGEAKKAGLVNRQTYVRLAGLLRNEGRYAESAIYLRNALSLEPKGDDYFVLGCLYALLDQTDQAFEALQNAVNYGYTSKQKFEGDDRLNALKSHARWEALISRLQ